MNREEVEKQKAEASYRKKHMAGKTEEAQRDLARLAIIRQQREEAAKKREAERKGLQYHECYMNLLLFFLLLPL